MRQLFVGAMLACCSCGGATPAVFGDGDTRIAIADAGIEAPATREIVESEPRTKEPLLPASENLDASLDATPDAALDAALDAAPDSLAIKPGCEAGQRYQISADLAYVLDRLTGLTWTRINGGPVDHDAAAQDCASRSMRLPTVTEALSLVGESNFAECAFSWSVRRIWTTDYDASNKFFLSFHVRKFDGRKPGAVICTEGPVAYICVR